MPRGKRINLLVVFDQSEKTYQWSLSLVALRVMLAVAIVTILMALAAIVLTWRLIDLSSRAAELAAENKRLAVYALEVNQIREELSYYRRFARRLYNLVGIETPDSLFLLSPDTAASTQLTDPPDSIGENHALTESGILLVSNAPTPGELTSDPENKPRGVPMRGRASRGFAPDEENLSLRHFGLDIAGREGSPVFATAAGVVELAGWDEAMGNTVVLDHGNGFKTIYSHNSVAMCKQGDKIQFGDIICLSGNSGISSAPHLHYEIRYYDQPVDPLQFILVDTVGLVGKQESGR